MEDQLSIITLTYDRDDDVARLDLGDLDPWSAYTMLYSALERLAESLPAVMLIGEDDLETDEAE